MIKVEVNRPLYHAICDHPSAGWSVYKQDAKEPLATGLSQDAAEDLLKLLDAKTKEKS